MMCRWSQGVEQMTYCNHEAIPEQPFVVDYFREVCRQEALPKCVQTARAQATLFRRHHFTLPLDSSASAALSWWAQRRTHKQVS